MFSINIALAILAMSLIDHPCCKGDAGELKIEYVGILVNSPNFTMTGVTIQAPIAKSNSLRRQNPSSRDEPPSPKVSSEVENVVDQTVYQQVKGGDTTVVIAPSTPPTSMSEAYRVPSEDEMKRILHKYTNNPVSDLSFRDFMCEAVSRGHHMSGPDVKLMMTYIGSNLGKAFSEGRPKRNTVDGVVVEILIKRQPEVRPLVRTECGLPEGYLEPPIHRHCHIVYSTLIRRFDICGLSIVCPMNYIVKKINDAYICVDTILKTRVCHVRVPVRPRRSAELVLPSPNSCSAIEASKIMKNCNLQRDIILKEDGSFCTFANKCPEGSVLKYLDGKIDCFNGVGLPCDDASLFKGLDDEKGMIIVEKQEKFCSVDKVIYKNCIDPIHVKIEIAVFWMNGKFHLLTNDYMLTLARDLDREDSYVCDGCYGNSCGWCNGPPEYLDRVKSGIIFKARGSGVITSTCNCSINPMYTKVVINHAGRELITRMVFSKKVVATLPRVTPGLNSPVVTVGKVTCGTKGDLAYEVEGVVNYTTLCSGSVCIEEMGLIKLIPMVLLLTRKPIEAWLVTDKHEYSRVVVDCSKVNPCDAIDCHFCFWRLLNTDCYIGMDYATSITVLAFWLLIILIIYKSLSLVKLVVWMMIKCVKGTFWFFYHLTWLSLRICGYKLLRGREKLVEIVYQDDNRVITKETSEPIIRVVKPRKVKARENFPLVIVIIFLMGFIASSLSCSIHTSITMEQLKCIVSEERMNCDSYTELLITGAPIGQVSCFSILDGKKSKGTVQFRTLWMKAVCSRLQKYWTLSANFNHAVHCRCRLTDECSENKCLDFNSDSSAQRKMYPDSANYAGETGCKFVAGGWENSCFSYGQACCYYNVQLHSNMKSPTTVSTCSSYFWKYGLEITTVSGGEMHAENVTVDLSGTLNVPFGTVSVVSSVSPILPFADHCYVKNENWVALLPCNVESMVAGKLGEIQCSDSNTTVTTGCRIAPGVVKIEPAGKGLSFSYNTYPLWTTMKKRTLPIITPHYSIEKQGAEYAISMKSHSQFTIHVSVKGMKLKIIEELATCTARFVNLTGCYSCPAMAHLSIETSANVNVTTGTIICPSFSSPLIIKRELATKIIVVSLDSASIDEECSLTCSMNTVPFRMVGKLYFIPTITSINTTMNYGFSDFTPRVMNFQGIIDFFKSIGSNYYLFSLSGVLLVLLIVIVLYKLFFSPKLPSGYIAKTKYG